MTFKVGDRVKLKYDGREGTVIEVTESGAVKALWDDGGREGINHAGHPDYFERIEDGSLLFRNDF